MERYYLNDVLITQMPQGVDGLTRLKNRSKRYGSILLKDIGYANGVGNVTFLDSVSRSILLGAYLLHDVDAVTEFRIETDDATEFSAYVDYSTMQWNERSVSCAFRDQPDRATLEASAATDVLLSPTDDCYLLPKRLSGPSTHTLTAGSVIAQSWPDPRPVVVYLPLQHPERSDATLPGTLATVGNPYEAAPFYRNTTTTSQALRLNGLLAARLRSDQSSLFTLSLVVVDAARPEQLIPLFQIVPTSISTLYRMPLAGDVVVPPGASLLLRVSAPNTTSYSLEVVGTESFVSLSAVADVPASTAPGLLAYNLLEGLVRMHSNGALSFSSSFLSVGEGQGLWLTNGANLRGINRPIKTNLQAVFDGLNAIWNLTLWLDGSVVRLETARDYLTRWATRGDYLTTIKAFSQAPDPTYLLNEIKIGYANWRGSNLLSADEFNAARTYQTNLTTVRGSLDLSCDLIASGTLLEEQRRKQFVDATASTASSDNLDDALFVLCTLVAGGKRMPEVRQNVSALTGLLDVDTPYNLRISPARNLRRWANVYPLRSLKPLTHEGNAGLICTLDNVPVNEADPIPTDADRLFTGLQATVEIPMTQAEFNALPDWVKITDGGISVEGLVMSANWRITDQQGGSTRLLLSC